jgi:predicted RNase H-like nuclease (RuvC/YqgF family)
LDIKDYCEITKTEIRTLKARAHEILLYKFEKISSDDRKKFERICNEIETTIKEIDERIDQLQRECPPEWNLQRNELDGKLIKLKEILETALPADAFVG